MSYDVSHPLGIGRDQALTDRTTIGRQAHTLRPCQSRGGVPVAYCAFVSLLGLILALVLFALPAVAVAAETESCPNAAVRAQQVHGLGLPDCRAYEQVSPVDKNGQDAKGAPGLVQSSPGRSGEALRVRYYSISPFNEEIFSGKFGKPTYISTRSEDGQWSTRGVLPRDSAIGQVEGFSEDLSVGLVKFGEGEPLGHYLYESATGEYLPLTGEAGLSAFSGNDGDVLVESGENLTGNAREGAPNVYELDLSDDALSLVGLLPGSEGGQAPPGGSIAGAGAGSNGEPTYPQSAISSDGSRVFFTALPSRRVYARLGGERTIAVSPGAARFREATPDGRYVFYTEPGFPGNLFRLNSETGEREELAGASATTGTGDLEAGSNIVRELEPTSSGHFFAGETLEGEGIPPATTIKSVGEHSMSLSAAATVTVKEDAISTPRNADVLGLLGVSGDGSSVYFAAGRVLAHNAHTITVTGTGTLAEGSSEVSALSESDGAFFAAGQEISGQGIPAATGTGTLTGSSTIENVHVSTGAFVVGQRLTATGIPANTSILALGAGTLTLSAPATASATGVALTASTTITANSVHGLELSDPAERSAAGVALTALAEEQAEESSQTTNLYEWQQNGTEPSTTFIAKLSTFAQLEFNDEFDWVDQLERHRSAGWIESSSRLTPDGGTLLFASRLPLTGYDNANASHTCFPRAVACEELFRYHTGKAGEPSLTCVSCNPAGSAAVSDALLTGEGGGVSEENDPVLSRNLSEDGGRVFFQSEEALLPSDTNHTTDVYEWEADGEGSCQTDTQDDGCVYLISSGSSTEQSYFGDASANGDDVFFFTRQALTASDSDNNVDVYDARVDGQEPPPCNPAEEECEKKTEPPCETAEECKPPPSEPPAKPYPATAAFTGPGNLTPSLTEETPVKKTIVKKKLSNAQKLAAALKACRKDRAHKKRVACEKQARSKYAPAKKAKQKGKR